MQALLLAYLLYYLQIGNIQAVSADIPSRNNSFLTNKDYWAMKKAFFTMDR